MRTNGSLLVVLMFVIASARAMEPTTLISPVRSGDQFQFELQGDAYRHYVIQGSSNLVNWVSLTTNFSSSGTRALSFAAANGFGFYRSAPFTRTNSISKVIQTTGAFDILGHNFVADSFNSTNPVFSTMGRYDVAKRNDAAEVCLERGLTNRCNRLET